MPSGGYDGRRRGRGERITSQPRRQVQARGGGRAQRYRSNRNYRTIRGTDTGYNLRKREINFAGTRGGAVGRSVSANPRPWILGVGIVGIALLLALGVSRCMRGCSADAERAQANEQDARVAVGTSAELTAELSEALDRGEDVAAIASRASDYDPRLVRLALAEPDAAAFVAAYDPDAQHEVEAFDETVTKGYYTPRYCWDPPWGAVDFAGGALAVTGSGPTSLFMARLGLVGQADLTPADVAARVAAAGRTDDALGMAAAYLTSGASELGLVVTQHEVSAESLSEVLDAGTVVLLQLGDGTLGDEPHWALAATENADGTINVCDPTSTQNSARPWAPSTLAGAADALYAVSAATGGETTGEGNG